ncbi:MAG: hypothetical protein NTV00_01805 [Methylococcales bacterium]|nr:hypothetical protein [Methylococcales bacterium]
MVISQMRFLNTCLFSLLIALSLGATSVAQAEAPAKIKNATEAEVRQALTDTIKTTEEALNALKSDASQDIVQAHISDARQLVKRVEINRLDVIRTRSSEKLKSARQALNKGEKAQAEEFLSAALKGFQEMAKFF